LVEQAPTRNAFLRLGSSAQDLGGVDDAEGAFTQALAIDPRSAVALWWLGSLALDRVDIVSAIDYLRKSCEIDETASALTVLGVALARGGEVHRQAIRVNADYEEPSYNLGVLLRQNGRPSEAQPLFRRRLSSILITPRLTMSLGLCL